MLIKYTDSIQRGTDPTSNVEMNFISMSLNLKYTLYDSL